MRSLPMITAASASALLFGLVVPTSPLSAQEAWEWEPDEGYHEEEWYDPSDWFDDDTYVDYETDWDDAYYDWGYYDAYYDPYAYPAYGYDPYVYEGYGADPFFDYEYYDDDFYFDQQADDWIWSSEQEQWVRRDERGSQNSNQRGQNRQQRRQREPQSGQNRQQRGQGQQQRGQNQQQQRGQNQQQWRGQDQQRGQGQRQQRGQRTQMATMRGTLENYSKVNLKGERDEHLIVRLKLEDGTKRLVNLGPRADLDELGLEQGKQVVVRGRKGHIDRKAVLMATRVTAGDDTTRVREAMARQGQRGQQERGQQQRGQNQQQRGRSMASLRGELDDWKKIQLGKDEHLFVRLNVGQDRRAIVNFGPNTEMSELDLERGDRVFVRGQRRQVSGKDVLFARDVRLEREPVQLDWRPSEEQRSTTTSSSSSSQY